jgi:hypothetical protein
VDTVADAPSLSVLLAKIEGEIDRLARIDEGDS